MAGRCSGGYVAIRAAVEDERLKADRFDQSSSSTTGIREPSRREHVVSVPRSFDDYGQRIDAAATRSSGCSRGEVDVLCGAVQNIVIAIGRRLVGRASRRLLESSAEPPSYRAASVPELLRAALGRRKVPLTLIYSEGDVGLDHMYFHFGPRRAQVYTAIRTCGW